MLSRDDAAKAAGRAAFAAARPKMGALPFRSDEAAEFCEAHPDANAEALYLHTRASRGTVVSWTDTDPTTRVACEVYRATFLALLRLVEAPPPPPRQKPRGHMSERIFDERAAGFGDRHVLRHRAASRPPAAARKVSAPAQSAAKGETSPAPSGQGNEPARPAPSTSSKPPAKKKGRRR